MNRLVGEESILWEACPSIALTMWVSIPSGDREIDVLRNALSNLVAVESPRFAVSSRLQILPLYSFSPPLPMGCVYVGAGCDDYDLKPSVWLNAFSFMNDVPAPLVEFKQFSYARPDLLNWLSPLASASVLVCDCFTHKCICHACVLLEMLNELSSVKNEPSNVDTDDEITCPECEPEEAGDDGVVPYWGQCNETLRGEWIPGGVGYPSSWESLELDSGLVSLLLETVSRSLAFLMILC